MKEQVVGHYASHKHGVVYRLRLPPPAPPTRPVSSHSMTIFKFELRIHGRCAVPMPQGSRLLSIGNQGVGLVIWAEVDEEQPTVERLFDSRFTGQVSGPSWSSGTGIREPRGEYVGTAILPAPDLPNGLVCHVYDLGEVGA